MLFLLFSLIIALPSSFILYVNGKDEPFFVKDEEDKCLDEVDAGPCQHYQIKWFWDIADESCKEFHYGGCMGSRNRFDTRQQCIKQCRYKLFNPVAVPDLCLLEPDQGFCGDERAGQWWYHFNSETGVCEKFFYYGCGGNDNKFYSLHMCRKVCAERLSPQIACEQCDIRTSFCKSHGRYNYTCECRAGYEKNAHGECVDIDECRGFTAVCDKNAWCTNTIGGFDCECMAAYRGTGKHCTYVGLGRSSVDCKECSPHATCTNGVCQCKEGFQGDGFNCSDVNECLKMPYICDKNAECINREGSFICTCLEGWAGNGYNCTTSKNACLDKFDHGYADTCGGENWRPHFYFDHETRMCSQFWYDGCRGRSRNIFSEHETCMQMCEETNVLTRAEVCWDKFDVNYKNQCLNGRWEQRYYFDHASLTCRQFWYDGCRSDSRNIFDDGLTCQWLCEEQPMYKSRACLEEFDERLKGECNNGRWRQQWYFDKNIKKCVAFWYDGCKSESRNLFQDELSCLSACENPSKKDPRKPWHNRDKFKMKEILGDIYKPNHTDKCVENNPCKNNGTCIYVWKTDSYYCKCKAGFVGQKCQDQIAFDPCAADPCKNGGSCQMVEPEVEGDKPTFECFCQPGFGGPTCDQRPCDTNPCLNNGTCRTTRAYSSYFCDCREGYGGKNCHIAIGATPPVERYGKNVELLSSGKEEWIAQMREKFTHTGALSTTGGGQKKMSGDEATAGDRERKGEAADGHDSGSDLMMIIADEPYKDPATKKREREEREKAAEKIEKEKEEEEIKQKAAIEEAARAEEERIKMERELSATSLSGSAFYFSGSHSSILFIFIGFAFVAFLL